MMRHHRIALARFWRRRGSHNRFALNRLTLDTLRAIYRGTYSEPWDVIADASERESTIARAMYDSWYRPQYTARSFA